MNTSIAPKKGVPRGPIFTLSEDKGFTSVLRGRVDQYFKENHLSPRGGATVTLKVILTLSLFAVSYGLMLSNLFSPLGTLLCAIVFGISNVLIVFCIAHDASHHALFQNRKLNKLFSYSFYLVGANSYLWNITHNQIHHTYPNVADYDTDIHQQSPWIRVSPTVPLKWYHHFQHFYAPILYLFYSLFLVFQKDFQDIGLLPKKDSMLLRNRKHEWKEYIIFVLSKSSYILITIIVPFVVLDVSAIQFIVGFLIVHFSMSILLAIVLIPVHMVDEAQFVVTGSDHAIQDSWTMHVVKNTVDYARKSQLANLFFGGLNTHLVHHIFPTICHIHYIPVSEILKKTASEFGVPYNEVSMKEAVLSHFRLLKRMSRA